MTDAIYAGTFDPVTLGHLDVIVRGSRLFDRVVVAVARNLAKRPLFSPEERVEMIRAALPAECDHVTVQLFDGLVVEHARSEGIGVLLRGLRNVDDFVGELQMALNNRDLAPEVETVFVAPSLGTSHVAGRLVREIAALGGDVSHLVPPGITDRLRARFDERAAGAE